MRWIIAGTIALALPACNGRPTVTFPTLKADPIAFSSTRAGETFTAKVVAPDGWEVLDGGVYLARTDGVNRPTEGRFMRPFSATVTERTLRITLSAAEDNLAANQEVVVDWFARVRLRGGTDVVELSAPRQIVRVDGWTPAIRDAALIADQASVLRDFPISFNGQPSTPPPGFVSPPSPLVPTHGMTCLTGQGFGVAVVVNKGRTPSLGRPMLLLYAPNRTTGDFTNLLPDMTYTLVGWAYATDFNPGSQPTLPGIPWEAWFVHEAGFHLLNGNMTLVPPVESKSGAAPQSERAVGHPNPLKREVAAHGRLWDLHIWRTTGGTPVLSINAPPDVLRPLPVNRPPGTTTVTLPTGAMFVQDRSLMTP